MPNNNSVVGEGVGAHRVSRYKRRVVLLNKKKKKILIFDENPVLFSGKSRTILRARQFLIIIRSLFYDGDRVVACSRFLSGGVMTVKRFSLRSTRMGNM